VLAATQQPDHATLARFRARHQDAIAGLFGQVFDLCVKAGLVDAGVLAIDGTKISANASFFANREHHAWPRSSLTTPTHRCRRWNWRGDLLGRRRADREGDGAAGRGC
jgi:hypothetical protein